jgi:hypothetical protein
MVCGDGGYFVVYIIRCMNISVAPVKELANMSVVKYDRKTSLAHTYDTSSVSIVFGARVGAFDEIIDAEDITREARSCRSRHVCCCVVVVSKLAAEQMTIIHVVCHVYVIMSTVDMV